MFVPASLHGTAFTLDALVAEQTTVLNIFGDMAFVLP